MSYQHIDELFTAQVDWDLIATLAPDMMRVAVSIRTGNILPFDILRRLNSSSRKNKLYFGLRELGRVVRTIFLLRYLSMPSCAARFKRLPTKAKGSISLCNGSHSVEIA